MNSLIEEVKKHAVLFDVNCPEYRCQVRRHEAWEHVADRLHVDAETAKSDWDRLRRCYINALHRRRNKKNGQPVAKKIRWRYEKQMAFLLPFIDLHRKSPITENPKITLPIDGSRDTLAITSDTSDKDFPPIPNSPAKKDCSSQATDEHGGEEDRTDESDMFFLSLSKMAKALPPLEQAKIKLTVSSTVLRAQAKHYEHCQAGTQPAIVDMECDVDFEPNQL